jgi:hypothetical protein
MMKIADFDDLNEFNLLSGLDLLPSTRSDRSVVGSHLSEPTIIEESSFLKSVDDVIKIKTVVIRPREARRGTMSAKVVTR